jgi:hypothetical protein
LVGWSIGIAATIILELALYPTVRNNDMSKLIDSYPDSVKQLFGLADFATGTGYVRAELFSFVLPLMVVLFGVLWGSDAIAGEEDRGTLDLVLANPITRRRVVAEKAAALLTGLAMVCAAMTVALVVGDAAFSVGVPVARLVAARPAASVRPSPWRRTCSAPWRRSRRGWGRGAGCRPGTTPSASIRWAAASPSTTWRCCAWWWRCSPSLPRRRSTAGTWPSDPSGAPGRPRGDRVASISRRDAAGAGGRTMSTSPRRQRGGPAALAGR